MLNIQKGDKVLDVGCGIGGSAFLMAEVVYANLYIHSQKGWRDFVQLIPVIGSRCKFVQLILLSTDGELTEISQLTLPQMVALLKLVNLHRNRCRVY